jgi:hypothetical protein
VERVRAALVDGKLAADVSRTVKERLAGQRVALMPRLDEKLFLETFQQPTRKKPAPQGAKR